MAQPSAVQQTVVADASLAAGALVDGVTRDLQACVKLMSCLPLFTASGRRTGWPEAHAHSEQVTCPGGPASAHHMAALVLQRSVSTPCRWAVCSVAFRSEQGPKRDVLRRAKSPPG